MRNKILEVARRELGTREYPPSSNNVRYNTEYYGAEVRGAKYPWCCVFVWWVFKQASASKLFFNGSKTAYCPALLNYHKSHGQFVAGDYQPGDIIFFNFNGGHTAQHVGICESWDGRCIVTIDGNTGSGNEANGGAVMRRMRNRKYIVGAVRPNYGEADVEMTENQIRSIVADEAAKVFNRLIAEQATAKPTADWQRQAVANAVKAGFSDGSNPMGLCKRVETMQMINKALVKAQGKE